MSEQAMELINDLLVDTFNEILKVEELNLHNQKLGKLSITEVHTIVAIGIDEKKIMSDVAADLKITTGTLTSCINKLEKKGYVIRQRSEDDRRVVYVMLTHKGCLVCKGHKLFHRNMVKNMVSGLSDNELDVLTSAIKNIKAFFDDEITKISK